jgi:hypothetical protein
MNNEVNAYSTCLRDILSHTLEKARQAKADHRAAVEKAGEATSQFESGRSMAYYEVLDHMLNELETFGISRATLGIPADLDAASEAL